MLFGFDFASVTPENPRLAPFSRRYRVFLHGEFGEITHNLTVTVTTNHMPRAETSILESRSVLDS